MASRKLTWSLLAVALVGCVDETPSGPAARLAPSFDRGGIPRQHTIVVNPNANGEAIVATIHEAIDMVEPGGLVQVKPGTYAEALVINKGLTLEGIGDGSEPVIIAPPAAAATAIDVVTLEPVTLRGLTVHVPGTAGIHGIGPIDLTVERSAVVAVNPPLGGSNLIFVANDAGAGQRARMVVRHTFLDGTITSSRTPPFPQSFGLRPQGDVDAVFEGNVLRRTGGACMFIVTRADVGGVLNADVLDNDLDGCRPLGRVAAILVGPAAGNLPSATRPLTATGVVNIIGNTIRN